MAVDVIEKKRQGKITGRRKGREDELIRERT